jgi:hypothetical protein
MPLNCISTVPQQTQDSRVGHPTEEKSINHSINQSINQPLFGKDSPKKQWLYCCQSADQTLEKKQFKTRLCNAVHHLLLLFPEIPWKRWRR